MKFVALATDYDGTLAADGTVDEPTVQMLRDFRDSGRKLLLVTGREWEDLSRVFAHTDLFALVVAENGGLLANPATGEIRTLAPSVPGCLADRLRTRGVKPLAIGRTLLATREPHEHTVLEVIHELGLEYHIIFNKGAVMVLPSGINKATGLKAALKQLSLRPEDVAGVGDAENDHAFLRICGLSAAVANALPALKAEVDLVTRANAGAGVAELVRRLCREDSMLVARKR